MAYGSYIRGILLIGIGLLWLWLPHHAIASKCPFTTGVLKYTEHSTPYTLTPLYTRNAGAQRALQLIFERLYDSHGSRRIPRLARRWQISKDRRQVVFYLRKGVRWHDGKPLTAADVAFTLKARARRPNFVDNKLLDRVMKRVVVLGRRKVKVELRLPLADPLAHLDVLIMPAHHSKSILSRAVAVAGHRRRKKRKRRRPLTVKSVRRLFRLPAIAAAFTTYQGWKPVGTGPFQYRLWNRRKIGLKRNPTYWRGPVCLRRVLVQWIPDHTLAIEVFRYGGVDFVPWFLPKWQKAMAKLKNAYRLHHPPSQAWWSLAFNFKHPNVRDRRVREALALFFAHKQLARFVGVSRLGSANPFLGFGANVKQKRLKQADALRRARQLLDQAGWYRKGKLRVDRKGQPMTLRMFWPYSYIFLKAIPLYYQDRLANEGIKLTIEYIRNKPFAGPNAAKGRYAMYFRSHATRTLPHLYGLFHSRYQRLDLGYQNKKVDGLLDRLLVERAPKQRRKWMDIIAQEVAYDRPHIFLWAPPSLAVHNQRVFFPKAARTVGHLFEISHTWSKK